MQPILLLLIKCLNPLVHLRGVAGLEGSEELGVMNRYEGGNGLDAAVASSVLILVNIAFQPIDSLSRIDQRVHIEIPAGAAPRRGKIDDGGSLVGFVPLWELTAAEELLKIFMIHQIFHSIPRGYCMFRPLGLQPLFRSSYS